METFSALLAICAGNSPVPGEFPAQRPVTRSFDVFCDLRLNKRLSKQWCGWWIEALSPPLWRHRNEHGVSNHRQHDYLFISLLTHWGRVAHTCVSKLTIIGSHNGLLPVQAFIWTNAGILLTIPLATTFNRDLHIFIQEKSFGNVVWKWRPFCLGRNVLRLTKKKRYQLLVVVVVGGGGGGGGDPPVDSPHKGPVI